MVLVKTLTNTPEAIDLLIADLDSASPEACLAFIQTLSASTLAIPYLILAEEIHDQAADALRNHGCLACIIKPFEPETLLRSVNNAFNQPSPHNEPKPRRTSDIINLQHPVNQPG
jgi:DNA-binding NtrC family response regulator